MRTECHIINASLQPWYNKSCYVNLVFNFTKMANAMNVYK